MADSTTRLRLRTDDDGALYVVTSEGLRVEGITKVVATSALDGFTEMELRVSCHQGLNIDTIRMPVQPRGHLKKMFDDLADQAGD